jgi:hypothetical protein
MRRRLSYANVTATLALVFAMSGGAMAANHYLITSTKQVSPSVLKKLTGKPGKNGTAGANGATGATGLTGPAGSPGTAGVKGETGKEGPKGEAGAPGGFFGVLPSGQTMRGTYAAEGSSSQGQYRTAVSFLLSLPSPPTAIHYIEVGETDPSGCTGGTVSNPVAAAGNLCIFEGKSTGNASNRGEVNPVNDEAPDISMPVYGFGVYASCETGTCVVEGTWAVTAP